MIVDEIEIICEILNVKPTKQQIEDVQSTLAWYALSVTHDTKLQEDASNTNKY